jgi:hypothetical protein
MGFGGFAMTEADKNKFAEIMTGLAENFGSQLSRPGLSMRFEALKEYSMEQVKQAAMSLMRSRKYTTMPTVAEFLEHLGGGSAEDLAEVEAAKVLDAIKRIGPYSSVAFDDPVTCAVVKQGYGSWEDLVEAADEQREHWFVKDFVRRWQAFKKQGLMAGGKCAGQIERLNSASGFGERKSPMALVGDAEKAKRLALEAGQNDKSVEKLVEKASALDKGFSNNPSGGPNDRELEENKRALQAV